MKSSKVLVLSAAIGVLAGLRSFTPPAVLSHAARRRCLRSRKNPLKLLATSKVANTLTSVATGELVADKLPSTPSRLTPGPLAARILSGAVCGAALCASVSEPMGEGAIAGAVGALAGSFAGYHLRQMMDKSMPDIAAALIEDFVAVGGSVAVVSQF